MKNATIGGTSRFAGLALAIGIAGSGCGSVGPEGAPTTNELPALTAEEQAVVDNMAKNTLAEIDLPEGKMRFIEVAPGAVLITREFAIGAKLTRVAGESGMTPEQVFHAYAPDRQIPRPLLEAAARVASAGLGTKAAPDANASPGVFTPPARPPESAPATDGVGRVQSALASSIDAGWFTLNFCNVSGADRTFCAAATTTGASASRTSHRTGSVTCADTASARSNFMVNGSVLAVRDIGYGHCEFIGFHGPHSFWNILTLRHGIVGAQSVRFAGWFADGDQFLNNAY
jgi:hypothetical protein